MSRYHLIKDKSEIDKVISACKATGYCCFDFETNAEKLYSAEFTPTLLSISFQPGSGIAIPLNHFESPNWFRNHFKRVIQKIGRALIEDPNIVKIGWNWKFDNQIMMLYDVYHKGVALDGMLAKYILDEERPMDLKSMTDRYLPEYSGYEAYEGSKLPWDKKPLEPLAKYGCMDTDMTFRLMMFFEKKLIDNGFYSLYRNLIMMASRALQDTERNGMRLDIPFNQELRAKYEKAITDKQEELRNIKQVRKFDKATRKERIDEFIDTLEQEIESFRGDPKKARQIRDREDKIARIIAGEPKTKAEVALFEPVNFGSQKQMVDLLFTHPKGFKLPVLSYTKKDKKDTTNPSTAEDALIELKNHDKSGFIDHLLDLRGLQTINSTFVLGIGDKVCPDERIHPLFNIHGTVTGRLSSKDPNFQNLPRPTTNPDIKKMMIPAEGCLFLEMDYSQAELRVLAHLAKEKTMLEWFRTGKDIHLASACKKYHVEYDDIIKIYSDEQHPEYKTWKIRRKQAKTINFGIAYEQTAMKLSESLSTPEHKVSVEEAQVFLDEFFRDFPNIKKFIKKQHKFAEKHGWVKTMFGRKRRLPNVYSSNYREYLEALRFSSNAPIQGTASDFALFSSVLMWEEVRKGNFPIFRQCTTVHDSLVFEIKASDITGWLVNSMWNICKNPGTKKYFGFQITDVNMDMDFSVGRNYAEELPFKVGFDYTRMLEPDFDPKELHDFKEPCNYREYSSNIK